MHLQKLYYAIIVLFIAIKNISDAEPRGNDSTVNQIIGNLEIRIRPYGKCVQYETNKRIIGVLEVNYFNSNVWSKICHKKWSLKEGKIACRELGYKGLYIYKAYCGYFSKNENGYLKYSQIKCKGDENSLKECILSTSRDSWCDRSQSSSLSIGCTKYTPQSVNKLGISLMKLNLSDNTIPRLESNCSGVVLVNYKGQNGYISSIDFDGYDGDVICRQLGYNKYLKPLPKRLLDMIDFNFSSTPIHMSNLKCSGLENEVKYCEHRDWGPYPQLEPYGVVSVQCQCEMTLFCDIPPTNSMRLTGTPFPWVGRIEVYNETTKEWGRVCSKTFNMESANVVCRQLGFGKAVTKFSINSHIGRGLGPSWFKDISCKGTERSLDHCSYDKSEEDYERDINCHGSNYYNYYLPSAKVSCEVPEHKSRVRLVKTVEIDTDKKDFCKLVEFEHEGNWLPHCCGNFPLTYLDVRSICREYSGSYAVDVGCTHIEKNKGQVLKGEFKCPRGSCYTAPCIRSMNVSSNCSSGNYTYVCCKNELPDLIVDKKELIDSLGRTRKRNYYYNAITTLSIRDVNCSIEDRCLRKSVLERASNPQIRNSKQFLNEKVTLLRFSTLTYNMGYATFYPPYGKGKWEWHSCHQHYHSMSNFVSYKLYHSNSTVVIAEGHKASFCLTDTWCIQGARIRHTCTSSNGTRGMQGISYGCYDSYPKSLDCQWVDISKVPSGNYILELILNPYKIVPESDFNNNHVLCFLKTNTNGGVILKWCRYSMSDEWIIDS